MLACSALRKFLISMLSLCAMLIRHETHKHEISIWYMQSTSNAAAVSKHCWRESHWSVIVTFTMCAMIPLTIHQHWISDNGICSQAHSDQPGELLVGKRQDDRRSRRNNTVTTPKRADNNNSEALNGNRLAHLNVVHTTDLRWQSTTVNLRHLAFGSPCQQ